MNAEAGALLACAQQQDEAWKRRQTIERDEAFAGLVTQHAQLMFRVAYSVLRHAHDAEDAVQEAFLKLYRGEAWRTMEDEKAFLARTVWRVALGRVSARSAPGRGRIGAGVEDVAGMDVASGSATPEQAAANGDERELLRLLIDGLPEALRQTLLLSSIEGMTSREVAATMGVPESTVRGRVMRAKAELKKRFEGMKGYRR